MNSCSFELETVTMSLPPRDFGPSLHSNFMSLRFLKNKEIYRRDVRSSPLIQLIHVQPAILVYTSSSKIAILYSSLLLFEIGNTPIDTLVVGNTPTFILDIQYSPIVTLPIHDYKLTVILV